MRIGLCLVLLMFFGSAAARAQTLEEIDKRDAAVVEAWSATALSVRRAVFVARRPDGFGQYTERGSNVFKPGEELVAYAEPVGYGWKERSDGQYEFGFDVDFTVRSAATGDITGKEDFARIAEQSHARNREFMAILTLNITGAPPGDYIVRYTLRDITGPKRVSFDLPFRIAK